MKNVKLISLALSMLICFLTTAQEKRISGTVTDKSKAPLPGVSIMVQKSKKATQTDFDGNYAIQAQPGDVLIFSYIGFKTENITVKQPNIINVIMQENSNQLQDVLVVGYGSSEYEDNSYSRPERKSRPVKASKVKAVSVQTSANYVQAAPNQNSVIRGVQSVSAKDEPLYIIDGIPVRSNQFAKVNPNDIQEVKVLKEDAATSIYGSKAGSGVVVVYTKNGIYKNLSEKELNAKLNIQPVEPSQEDYNTFVENDFESPKKAPLSTFSIDVDNASYTNVRRFINNGQAVPKDAVRVEEMVNFFKYNYPQPKDQNPFSINTELSDSPWNAKNKVLKIGLQGKNIPTESLPASNLVFLIDVSGSMSDINKLPLLKQSLKILVNELREKDKVAIVVYAGAAGLVLAPTSGNEKQTINNALEKLNAGGSTAGGAGIELAYKIATENFIKNGNNRVILATDGDFNVGSTSNTDMEKLIEEKRKSGVFLTCLGYGMGNYKDSKMETLADKGNGNYAYIDNIQEANRFLGKEFKGSMFAIAKDVKIQIEFNPKQIQAYRLIGYENRKLRPEDFKNDAIDAGELGSNHTVTALYEIIPAGVTSDYLNTQPDDLKYTKVKETDNNYKNELATIKFRYKKPDGDKSIEIVQVIENKAVALEKASDDFKFSTAVAWFGLKLRDSKLISNTSPEDILKLAKQGISNDTEGYKAEFIRLTESAKFN
jgi:Ca-activated chloride channel family protein